MRSRLGFLLVVGLLGSSAYAAAPVSPTASKPAAKGPQLAGEEVDLKADDGWALKARYQAAQPGKATVVLLHGRGNRKEFWRPLAKELEKAGYGYIAPDFRGHGESQVAPDGQTIPWRKLKATAKGENDYAKMALDVQASMAFLGTKGVEETGTALIGQDVGGSIALRYAAVHAKVPLVVMLSPGLSYQEVTAVNAMRAYKERPILMVYGTLDRYASSSAPILYQFAKMSVGAERAALVSIPETHGLKLLNAPAVTAQIVDWLGNPVPPAPAVSTAPVQGAEPTLDNGENPDPAAPQPGQ